MEPQCVNLSFHGVRVVKLIRLLLSYQQSETKIERYAITVLHGFRTNLLNDRFRPHSKVD